MGLERLSERGEPRVTVRRERAAHPGVTEPEELVQRCPRPVVAADPRRERDRRAVTGSGRPGDRIEDAVDDHRPDPVREHVRVGLTEDRPVGDAGVVQLRVADGLAQHVHIPGDIGGRHVSCDAAAALGAGRVDEEVCVHPQLLFSGIGRKRDRQEERAPLPVGTEAPKRGAARDPARVEADEIEPRAHLVGVEGRPSKNRVDDARAAGPARVEEQRTDPMSLVSGRQPDDPERDRRAVGLVVIERYLHRPALERPLLRVALAPSDLRRGATRLAGHGACADAQERRAHHSCAEFLHPAFPFGTPV